MRVNCDWCSGTGHTTLIAFGVKELLPCSACNAYGYWDIEEVDTDEQSDTIA